MIFDMIPSSFDPPRSQWLTSFQVAVLGPRFAEQDYQAVRGSADRIRHVFGPNDDWPDANISWQENHADLVRHEREFDERIAFAYALLDQRGSVYLGCLYLRPIRPARADDRRPQCYQVQAFLWLSVLQSAVTDAQALAEIRAWLGARWPLVSVAWPGRDPGWPTWEALALGEPRVDGQPKLSG
jgi:hypothetical protein